MFDSTEQAWAQLQIWYNGNLLVGARAVRYKVTSDDEALHAMGREPISIQKGNKNYEGDLGLLKSEVDKLQEAAIAAGYNDLSDMTGIDIVVTYAPIGVQVLKTDKLKLCSFGEFEYSQKQGDKFFEITCPFKSLGLVHVSG